MLLHKPYLATLTLVSLTQELANVQIVGSISRQWGTVRTAAHSRKSNAYRLTSLVLPTTQIIHGTKPLDQVHLLAIEVISII
ncbi:hypothetical protein BGX38DRAFT_1214206 [Terfezia claveryi]|nr:hypothetical protein BGX38DRAFT_1214206 [Terfezia claveryi]